jgi:CSLREA domain-containing protein
MFLSRLALCLLALSCVAAQAGIGILVTTAEDNIQLDGQCSLREAIINANSNSQAGSVDCAAGSFDPSAVDHILIDTPLAGQTIVLNAELPTITEAVAIIGPLPQDAAGITLDGGGASRILQIAGSQPSDFSVALRGLRLRNGRSNASQAHGGALLATNADLALEWVRVEDSRTAGFQSFGGGVAVLFGAADIRNSRLSGNRTEAALSAGGAIAVLGSLLLVESEVSDNRTEGNEARGGGLATSGNTHIVASALARNATLGSLAHGGAVATSTGDLALVNSTVSGNTADGAGAEGGAAYVEGGSSTLLHATLAFNRASGVDGLVNTLSGPGHSIQFHSSLIVQARDNEVACSALAAGHSGSLATDASCTGIDTSAAAIGLKALSDNSGPTPTHAIGSDSAALGLGGDCPGLYSVNKDQRGQPRPGTGSILCDAGAYEFQPPLCATTAGELQAALQFAASNGIDDEIRIAAGHYPAPPGGFEYSAQFGNGDIQAIAISGGWTALGNDPCGEPGSGNPFETVLDGGGSVPALRIALRGSSAVRVRALTLANGFHAFQGGGLKLALGGSFDVWGSLAAIEGNAFVNNSSALAGGLSVSTSELTGGGRILVSGNLFLGNHASEDWGAGVIWAQADPQQLDSDAGLFLIGNTVLDNTTESTDASACGGIYFANGLGGLRRVVANNLMWGNQAADLLMTSAADYELLHNNIGQRSGWEPAIAFGNLSVAPQFEACAGCDERVPVASSPLVDAGYLPGVEDGWSLPSADLLGRARIAGSGVDIGAFENHSRLFRDGFEP